MKKFQYMNIAKADMKEIIKLGREGWEMCGYTKDSQLPFVEEFWFKREMSDTDYIGLLTSCSYMRKVQNLQHRTISEFAQFVEDVMSGKPGYEKYQDFDWNSTDAIEQWIVKFHDYCKEYYRSIGKEELENKT